MNTKVRIWGGYIGFYLLIVLVAITINARFNSLDNINNPTEHKIASHTNN